MSDIELTKFQRVLNLILGIIGLSLPAILYFINRELSGENDIRGSISSYYYSDVKYIFMGYLFAMGVLLIIYKGYQRKDNIWGYIGGAFAFMVAIFPTIRESETERDFAAKVHVAATVGLYFV